LRYYFSQIPGLNYDAEKKTFICAANTKFKIGKVSSQGFITYRTSTKNCRNCGLKETCQVPKEKGRETHSIARHIHAEIFQEVKMNMETEEFKQKLRERLWKVEGVMNELKNCNGLSRAKWRGLKEVQKQAYMAAIAINIKRIIFIFYVHYLWI
jgi:hypothetical protein